MKRYNQGFRASLGIAIALLTYGGWQHDRSIRPLGEVWQVAISHDGDTCTTNGLLVFPQFFRDSEALLQADRKAEIEPSQSGKIYLMLIKSNFLMSEIPIFTLAICLQQRFAIAANISTNDHLERAGAIS